MTIAVRVEPRTAAMLAVLLVAAALRLAHFNGLHLADDPDYAARAYAFWSGQGGLYADVNGFRIGTWMPASLGYAVLGVTHAGLVVYPLVMSLVGVWLVYALARLLFGTHAGLVAATLYAWYPLDVELASRLLPDSLLSACTVLVVWCLVSADIVNGRSPDVRLQRGWLYAAGGAVLGWCTLVNMSSVAFIVFGGLYVIASTVHLLTRFRGLPRRTAWRVVVTRRLSWLALGLFVVLGIEAFAYHQAFGRPLLKYAGTLSHYTLEGRPFFQDLWHYPRHMFFLRPDWRIDLLDANGRVYGFYFLSALPALAIGLLRGGRRFALAGCWLIATWSFLQWGTMSFTSWTFLHRLDRHLDMITPALVLVIAGGYSRIRRPFVRQIVLAVVLLVLIVTSWTTIRARHRQLQDDVAVMTPIHHILQIARPAHVYTDTQTIAYQRFLDRYEDQGRVYEPLETTRVYATARTLAIVQAVSRFSVLPSGVDARDPPPQWLPFARFPDAPDMDGVRVRIYRIAADDPRPAESR